MLVRALTCCAFLLLAACAAALPGYTPPPFKKTKLIEPMKSGYVDQRGVYHMSGQEKATDCRHLRGSILVTISRLRQRGTEVAASPFASGAHSIFGPIFGGSTKGSDQAAGYARDRARLAAYNRHLASKGCATIDVKAELARPSAGM